MFVPVLIVGIVFGSALLLVKMTLDYKKAQALAEPTSDGSLRTSELEALIRRAVDDAVQNALEPYIEREKLLPPGPHPTPDDTEDHA
jgi:hypothetical protein